MKKNIMAPLENDNRLFERFLARFPVKFQHSEQDYGTNVFLRDASAQGAKFSTSERVYVKDSVSLLVKLPDGGDPLSLNGRVVWVKEKFPNLWDAGLQFHKANFMQLQRMYRLVRKPSFIF